MKIHFLFVFVLLILSCKEQSTLPDNSLPADGNSYSGYSNVLNLESMSDQKFEEHIKNIKSSSCDFKEEDRGQQYVQGTLVNNFLSGVGGNPISFSKNSGNCYQQRIISGSSVKSMVPH